MTIENFNEPEFQQLFKMLRKDAQKRVRQIFDTGCFEDGYRVNTVILSQEKQVTFTLQYFTESLSKILTLTRKI